MGQSRPRRWVLHRGTGGAGSAAVLRDAGIIGESGAIAVSLALAGRAEDHERRHVIVALKARAHAATVTTQPGWMGTVSAFCQPELRPEGPGGGARRWEDAAMVTAGSAGERRHARTGRRSRPTSSGGTPQGLSRALGALACWGRGCPVRSPGRWGRRPMPRTAERVRPEDRVDAEVRWRGDERQTSLNGSSKT